MKTKYVIQLDNCEQIQIKKDLKDFFENELDLTDEEIKDELDLAMSSRLSDLEDSIDISPYIDKK